MPTVPKIDIVEPDKDALSNVSHIAVNITDRNDRLKLSIFNKVFADRLLSYPADAQQINDVYTLAAKNVFGSSLNGKYASLGGDLTDLMESIMGDENHTLGAEEKELTDWRLKMDIIGAAEADCRARMDRYAYEMNISIQNQLRDDNLNKFMSALTEYETASSQFNVVQELKKQIESHDKTGEESNEG